MTTILEEHYEFARATATAEAVRIGTMLNCKQDIPDIRQQLLCHCVFNQHKYNASRSKPKTFLNLLIRTAGKLWLRNYYRMKNNFNNNLESLEEMDSEPGIIDESEEARRTNETIHEYLEAMPEGMEKDVCKMAFIEGMPLGKIAAKLHMNPNASPKARITRILKRALRPLAIDLGYISESKPQGEQDKQPPEERPPP